MNYLTNEQIQAETAHLTARVAELETLLVAAVELGSTQAAEWDKYWRAIGAGTSDITVDDVIRLWQEREQQVERYRAALRTIHNRHGVINCVSYTRKRIVADYQENRSWVQALIRGVLGEDGPYLSPEMDSSEVARTALKEEKDGLDLRNG